MKTPENIRYTLISALTAYDITQQKKASYNRYALAIYMQMADHVVTDIEFGAPVREAIVAGFTGRILDRCLKAFGMEKGTDEEHLSRANCYVPVSEKAREMERQKLREEYERELAEY